MNERWKPKEGDQYYFLDSVGGIVFDPYGNFTWMRERIAMGNYFKTEAEAKAAAEKVKALLLSLQDNETSTANDESLPKLTAEVFNRPDCPGWAKWAAVDRNGIGYFFPSKPSLHPALWVNHSTDKCAAPISGKFDASDWQNSLIERPATLPDWCKVGAWVWDDEDFRYVKVESIADTVLLSTDSKLTYHEDLIDMKRLYKQARLRPYNADEMRGLVGKVIKDVKGNVSFVTGFRANNPCIFSGNNSFTADVMMRDLLHMDNAPCGVLEHLENGEWVE